MKVISLTEIKIPENRQRREFDPDGLRELAESILDKGLMNPITVRDDGVTLVAGERRLRAIISLSEKNKSFECDGAIIYPGRLPVVNLGDLSEFQIREAELEENIIRKDLTWQERAGALADLQALRQDQHGVYDRKANPEGWSTSDTISEIFGDGKPSQGKRLTSAVEDIRLASHLDDPEVASAKTKKEALKIVRKKAEKEKRARLAEKYDLSQEREHTIICDSAFTILPTLENETFDLIITDPPYGVDAQDFGSQADAKHEYVDDWDFAQSCYKLVAKEGWRVTKENAHVYAFCDIERFYLIRTLFEASGWQCFPSPLIWDKRPVGMLPYPDFGPRRTYETIIYAWKGERKLNGIFPDIISVPGVSKPIFGAQKPPELYNEILRRSAIPGDRVLDMFAGTGPLLPPSTQHRCRSTLIELNQDKVNYIRTLDLDTEPQNVTTENPLESIFR